MGTIGALILAGGKSRRMQSNKALLQLEGKTFLERIAGQLTDFDEVLLSVADPDPYRSFGLAMVEDIYRDSGPLGGLHAALSSCRSDGLLVMTCDMPLLERGLLDYIAGYVAPDLDAVMAVERGGRKHPLCGYYSKSALPVLEQQLRSGDYRVWKALTCMEVGHAPLYHSIYPDRMLANLNTPEEYAAILVAAKGPRMIAVSGVKNSGKTTLLTGILPLLCEKGLRVGVIKHDGHDFLPDVPGTDSYRVREAGARAVAVYSSTRYMISGLWEEVALDPLYEQMKDMDLILLEGGKQSPYPKLELVRQGVSTAPVCDPDTLLALCTDTAASIPGMPVLGLSDYPAICQVILDYLKD